MRSKLGLSAGSLFVAALCSISHATVPEDSGTSTVKLAQADQRSPSTMSGTDCLVSQGLGNSAYTASDTYLDRIPARAFDGDGSTFWDTPNFAGWIEVDLGAPLELSRIHLQVNMSPDGQAHHQVWVSLAPMGANLSGATLTNDLDGFFANHQQIEQPFPVASTARYVQVRTLQSVSWVGWDEIQVYANGPDADGDGYNACADCSDHNPAIHPGGVESCDAYDNDCNGAVDDSPACDQTCDGAERVAGDSRLTNAAGTSVQPCIAWSGNRYGTVWADSRGGSRGLYFALVDAGGQRVGPDSLIAGSPGDPAFPAVVWTGSEYGVAWADTLSAGRGVYFTRISAAGVKLAPEFRVSEPSPGFFGKISLVWTGREFGLAWQDGRHSQDEIYFARLDRLGTKLTTDLRITSAPSESREPSLTWTGTTYGVAWQDEANPEIFMALLDEGGNKLTGDIRLTNCPVPCREPSLAWAGQEFGVAWQYGEYQEAEVYFTRVDANGTKIASDSPLTQQSGFSGQIALAWNGLEFAVSWKDTRSAAEIYWRRVDASGSAVGNEIRVSDPNAESAHPSIAYSGESYGVVWEGHQYLDGSEINFARIGCNCTDADADGVTNCNDCDDADPTVRPGTTEICNGVDDNCNALVDDDPSGMDTDGDGVYNACDNCVIRFNADQRDQDLDSVGNACDNCLQIPNRDQLDTDADALGDACDNCRLSYNPSQTDTDADLAGDVCDNCFNTRNESQHDFDLDGEGDECDLNDGVVIFQKITRPRVRWQSDPAFASYNLYRGSLAVLLGGGPYSQVPGNNPYAGRFCGVTTTFQDDAVTPATGDALYWLVAGKGVSSEAALGSGDTVTRSNANPCP